MEKIVAAPTVQKEWPCKGYVLNAIMTSYDQQLIKNYSSTSTVIFNYLIYNWNIENY